MLNALKEAFSNFIQNFLLAHSILLIKNNENEYTYNMLFIYWSGCVDHINPCSHPICIYFEYIIAFISHFETIP